MKKSIFFIFIFLINSALLCACSNSQNNVSDKPLNEYLITKSIELTCTMDSLAQSEEYINLLTPQSEAKDLIADIGASDYQAPNKSVLISVSDAAINSIMEKYIGKLNLPDDAYKQIITRMYSSVPNIINGQEGVYAIAAASILSVSKSFQMHKDFTDTTYVVLIYDNYSSVTIYSNSVEGITSAYTTFFFLTDDMKKAIMEETAVNYLFENFGINGVKIEYIDGDKIAGYK